MARVRALAEYSSVAAFSFFLFITPYSRFWGKYSLYASLAILSITRLILLKGDLKTAFFVSDVSNRTGFLLLAACFASVVFSLDPYHSQKIFFSRYLLFILSAWAGCVIGREYGRNALILLVAAFQFSALYMGYGGVYDYTRLPPGEIRLWTIWRRYTPYCMLPLYLTYFITFNASFILNCRKPFFRSFGLINLICLIPTFIWQICRSAYPAVAAGLVFISYIKSRKVLLWLLAAMVAAVVALAVLSPAVSRELGNYADLHKWDNRLPLFKSALAMFYDHPLTGSGIGMYENLIKTPAYEPPAEYMPQYRFLFIHAHNFYLETLAEMGFFGIIAFGALFGLFFTRLIRKARIVKDNVMRSLLIAAGSVAVVYLVFGITLSIITVGLTESAVFWLFFGIAFGLIKREACDG